jgi:hypothetical protein
MMLVQRFQRITMTGLLVVVAACSAGDATSPAPRLSGSLQRQLLPNGEVMQAALAVAPANAQSKVLDIDDDVAAWYTFGPHKIWVEGGSLCAASSPYGAQYWLKPCTRSEDDAIVTVKWWTDSQGYVRVDFGPDLRFAPAKPAKLYLKDPKAATQGSSAVLYCQSGTSLCVNESLADPTLVTMRDPATGWVWRLIRHFSGYNVWA